MGARAETAIAYLADLEAKLDVAQVQLEVHNTLLPLLAGDAEPDVKERIRLLSSRLFTMSEVRPMTAVPETRLIRRETVVSGICGALRVACHEIAHTPCLRAP
jgi:hypothetical protein